MASPAEPVVVQGTPVAQAVPTASAGAQKSTQSGVPTLAGWELWVRKRMVKNPRCGLEIDASNVLYPSSNFQIPPKASVFNDGMPVYEVSMLCFTRIL